MDVLVIGGSVFLGRAVVGEALAAGASGHRLQPRTVGHRHPTASSRCVGDRTSPADLAPLAGRHFDVVVDTCGYVPADVAPQRRAARSAVGHYAFVSSINAFPGWPEQPDYRVGGIHDGSPDATRDDVPAGLSARESYGWLKVGCERAVERAFGADRCSVLRAGAICGPHDSAIGRLPWWLDRVARGGEVLVPGRAERPDRAGRRARSRPLRAGRGARRLRGARPARARHPRRPDGGLPGGDRVRCATFTYVEDEDWLVEQGVDAVDRAAAVDPGPAARACSRPTAQTAAEAGLRWRPLAETVADTWAWQQCAARAVAADRRRRPASRPSGSASCSRPGTRGA